MKNLSNIKMENVRAGYSAWACFWAIPKLIGDGAGPAGAVFVGADIALINYCWNN